MSRFKDFILGKRTNANSPPPYLLSFRSSKLFILTTICIAVFTDMFLYGIIVPVIPFALSDRVGIAADDVQHWVSILLAAYGGAMLVGSPIAGWFADNSSSRRAPLLVGLLALAGATLMLCLARTVALLVLGRILQGLSAAIVWTVGQALIVDTVGQAEIGEMLGYVSFSMTIGFMISPLIGGVVYERAGYYPVFYICFALILLDILLRVVLVEKKTMLQWAETLPSIEINPACHEASEIEGNDCRNLEKSPESPQHEAHPVADLSPAKPNTTPPILQLLRSRRLLAALWGVMIQATLTTAFDTTLPLFVQNTFGWNSVGAGLIFLCLIVPSFTAPAVGWVSDRYGSRWLVVGGFTFPIPFWVLLRLVTYNSLGQKVLLCALLVLIGIAFVLVLGPIMAEITYVVEAKEKHKPGLYGNNGAYAQAYGLFTMAFSAGTLIGPFWAGYIEVASGWGTMTWTLALLNLAGAIPSLIWTGGLISHRNAKSSKERAIGGPVDEVVNDAENPAVA